MIMTLAHLSRDCQIQVQRYQLQIPITERFSGKLLDSIFFFCSLSYLAISASSLETSTHGWIFGLD